MDEVERLREENKRLRQALGFFTIAFQSRPEKINHSWSFGYWDPMPEELTIANTPRFNAVIRCDAGEIKTIQAAVAGEANETHQRQAE